MKTTAIKSAFIAIIAIASSIFSVSAQDYSNYFFDRKTENGQVVSSTRYELGYSGLFEKTHLYEYSYDELGNLAKKETFKWNSRKSEWIPEYCIEHSYSVIDNSINTEYSAWNKKENKFNPVSEKATYWMDDLGNIVSCGFSKAIDKTYEETTMVWSKNQNYF